MSSRMEIGGRGGTRSSGGEAQTGEVGARTTDARRIAIKVGFNTPPLRWDGGEVIRWSERC